jgi:hypothetical protein
MGMERFLTIFYDDEDLIHEMFEQAAKVLMANLTLILERVKIDFAHFCEDLAGRNGPLVSPTIYDEFWAPYQKPILKILKEAGVPVICQWSAGEFEQLIPTMMYHGINCTFPLKALVEGPEAIDREIDTLMPLIKEGGFIPALDDMVPLECPFSHYRHMIERLQAIRLD